MEFTKSTINDKVVHKIDESSTKSIIERLNKIWLNKSAFCYPGPQPISIERKHLTQLNNDYHVCEKSDGIRYSLICIKREGKNIIAILDRTMSLYLVSLCIPSTCYEGTILDGELLNTSSGLTFLVYDCVLICGRNVSTYSFKNRLEMSKTLIDGINIRTKDTFAIRLKLFQSFNNMKHYVNNELPLLDYKNDGFIFIPDKCNVQTGTHNNLFKWKPRLDNTIDFYINDKQQLYLKKSDDFVKTQNKLIDDIDYEDCIIECKSIDIIKRTWKFVQVRSDKSTPNSLYTFRKTLNNIRENIQICEFFNDDG